MKIKLKMIKLKCFILHAFVKKIEAFFWDIIVDASRK
jgi:hypothetical protein